MALHALLAIRTRWLVLAMVVAVLSVGVLAYWDERARSDAELADFGGEQASVAEAAANAGVDAIARLDRPPRVRVILLDRSPHLIDGTPVALPQLAAALAHGDRIARIDRDDAPALGLPQRTAMIGIAPGRTLAIAATAERQRDRDRAGMRRTMLALVLATGLVTAFGGLALARQRAQLGLARDAELERLSRAATMAALGSGVAHELSTPLGVIVGRAEQLRGRGDERIDKSAQVILEQADHIDKIVRGLLGMARGAPIALAPAEPRALVGEAAALVEHRFARAGVRLAIGAAEAPRVRCEPLLFKHALVNLMLNACDASPRGSTVAVDVTCEAGLVAFVVSDEGSGIAPADAARAVEPFFTTKREGTGLGLAIAKEIASVHRGTLELVPRTPRGTRASIRIPIEGGSDA